MRYYCTSVITAMIQFVGEGEGGEGVREREGWRERGRGGGGRIARLDRSFATPCL